MNKEINKNTPALIGISGKAGSGKDTVANIIQNLTYIKSLTESDYFTADWQVKKFAYAVKQVQSILREDNTDYQWYVQEDNRKEIFSVDLQEEDKDAVLEVTDYISLITG